MAPADALSTLKDEASAQRDHRVNDPALEETRSCSWRPKTGRCSTLRPLRFGNVHVLRGKALGKLIRADGPLTATDVTEIEHALALALPTA
jgi:hypothetical protein